MRVRIIDFGIHSPSGRYTNRVHCHEYSLYGCVINTNTAWEGRPIFVEMSRLKKVVDQMDKPNTFTQVVY
jgi:hypothetical protein